MSINIKQDAVKALLAEYKKSIIELQATIMSLSPARLTEIVDPNPDNECSSIEGILAHVVSSGYSYCVYIRGHKGMEGTRPPKLLRETAGEFIDDLHKVVEYTEETFRSIYDYDLEEPVETQKIKTAWGQAYDIEQLFEHAIVHVLRHRRQIERLLLQG